MPYCKLINNQLSQVYITCNLFFLTIFLWRGGGPWERGPGKVIKKCDWEKNTTQQHLNVHLICRHYRKEILKKFNLTYEHRACSECPFTHSSFSHLIIHLGLKHKGLHDCMIDDGIVGHK